MINSMEIKLDTYGRMPIRLVVTPDSFGELFANMGDDEQIECLRAIFLHMSSHPTQWDYIAMRLEEDDNKELRRNLNEVFGS